ncbi:hypothetical protein [Pasteuria penetrans]|uniref:hypothetical protein n=1 Tax=Pasteuria penetrans TaxID=86005 RepID=UPI000FC0BB9A|nr:hypothetical protein [Pasteuria penetrans]
MTPQHCGTTSNHREVEEAEKKAISLQNRLLSMIGSDNLSDMELAYIIFGLFFTEYAPSYMERYGNYHNTIGRPCTHILISLIIDMIKEFLKCSDRILIDQLPREGPLFEALDGKKGRPLMGERTLYEGRNRLGAYEETTGCKVRDQFYFDFTQFLMEIVSMYPSLHRMDASLIESCIRKLSRNTLALLVIKIAVRQMAKLSLPIPPEWEIFLQPNCGMADINGTQAFSCESLLFLPMDDPTDKVKQRTTLLEICLALECFGNKYERFQSTPAYILLQRMVGEQTEEIEQGGQKRFTVRSEWLPGSLQDPLDPDAQDRIKGKQLCREYVCSLVRACDEKKEHDQPYKHNF